MRPVADADPVIPAGRVIRHLPALLLIAGILTTAALCLFLRSRQDEVERVQFSAEVDRLTLSMRSHLERKELIMRAARGLFDASDFVSKSEWHAFAQSIISRQAFPSVEYLGFIARVPAAELDQFVADTGTPLRTVDRSPLLPAQEYFIIRYSETLGHADDRVGTVLSQDHNLREAIDHASHSRQLSISSAIDAPDLRAHWVALFLPVFDRSEEQNVSGWIGMVLDLTMLMQEITATMAPEFRIDVVDGSVNPAHPLYDRTEPSAAATRSTLERTLPFPIGGKVWHVRYRKNLESTPGRSLPVAVTAAGGIAVSLLGAGICWLLLSTRARARRLAERMAEVLAQRTARYELLVSAAGSVIVALAKDGSITEWNREAERYFGVARDDALGKPFLETFVSDERCREAFAAAESADDLASERPVEQSLQRADGEMRTVSWNLNLLKDGHRESIGLIAVGRDITERKSAEQSLRENHAYLRAIFDSGYDAIAVTDVAGDINLANEAAARLFHSRAEQLVGSPLASLFVERSKGQLSALLLAVLRGSTMRAELEIQRADGSHCPVEISVTRGRDTRTFLLWTIRDVTAEKIMRIKQTQAGRIEAIGALAAGIAHEINTPAQFVNDNLAFFQSVVPSMVRLLEAAAALRKAQGSNAQAGTIADILAACEGLDVDFLTKELPSSISESVNGVNRIAEIVRAMKAFAHPGSQERKPIDVNAAIKNTVTVARNEWKYVAEMHLELDPALPPVPCFAGELNQAILNLIVNAAQAITEANKGIRGKKGSITVRTARDKGWVAISIADSGTGIPEAIRDRIFDPFFTTKEIGLGSGQGLAIVQSVANKHQGEVSFETEVGRGTAFTLRLPLEPQSAAASVEEVRPW